MAAKWCNLFSPVTFNSPLFPHFAALVILSVLVIASAIRAQICKLKLQEAPGFLHCVLKGEISDEDITPQSMYIQHKVSVYCDVNIIFCCASEEIMAETQDKCSYIQLEDV